MPNDRIATNVHCHQPGADRCLTGSYWIAGYAERRVLVEGWAYRTRVDDTYPGEKPQSDYWDQEKLRLNDEVFTDPTRELLETLRTQVRRPVAAASTSESPSPRRTSTASTELRFQLGTVRVYQLYPPPHPTRQAHTDTQLPHRHTRLPTAHRASRPARPARRHRQPNSRSGPFIPTQTNPIPSGTLPTSSIPTQSFTPTVPFPTSTPPSTPGV